MGRFPVILSRNREILRDFEAQGCRDKVRATRWTGIVCWGWLPWATEGKMDKIDKYPETLLSDGKICRIWAFIIEILAGKFVKCLGRLDGTRQFRTVCGTAPERRKEAAQYTKLRGEGRGPRLWSHVLFSHKFLHRGFGEEVSSERDYREAGYIFYGKNRPWATRRHWKHRQRAKHFFGGSDMILYNIQTTKMLQHNRAKSQR